MNNNILLLHCNLVQGCNENRIPVNPDDPAQKYSISGFNKIGFEKSSIDCFDCFKVSEHYISRFNKIRLVFHSDSDISNLYLLVLSKAKV